MLLYTYLHNMLQDAKDADKGATMVEYGLLVALIAIVVAVGAAILGTSIDTLFDKASSSLV